MREVLPQEGHKTVLKQRHMLLMGLHVHLCWVMHSHREIRKPLEHRLLLHEWVKRRNLLQRIRHIRLRILLRSL